jgi:hypothetical protein
MEAHDDYDDDPGRPEWSPATVAASMFLAVMLMTMILASWSMHF